MPPPQAIVRSCLFVTIAAILSLFSLYVGILALQIFAVLAADARLYAALGLCSGVGAITYGSLIRIHWIKKMSSRAIMSIAAVCVAASLLAFVIRGHFQVLGAWWLTAAWWFAFSGGLCYFDTQKDARGRSRGESWSG